MKKTLLSFSLLAVSVACLSFAFSKKSTDEPVVAVTSVRTTAAALSVYDSLQLDMSGLSREAFEYTMNGLKHLEQAGQLTNDSIVSIVDFTKPSSEKRLYIIDIRNYRILFNTWVAHGRNSGRELPMSFSNTMSSLKSSLGFYRTGETYMGGHGLSLRLHGLERGINDRALARAIVLHGADYVSPGFLQSNGFMGRSFGCPAVSNKEVKPIIEAIKGGSCLFIYSTDKHYLSSSALVQEAA